MIHYSKHTSFRSAYLFILGIAVGLLGCEDKVNEILFTSPKYPIRLEITKIDKSSSDRTKTLIDDIQKLQEQCALPGRGIGIYGEIEENTGLLFDNTRLYYQQNWKYDLGRSWENNKIYHFFAYFPYCDSSQSMVSFDASKKQLNYFYDTTCSQDELLVAYTSVNTSVTDVIKTPVQLKLRHTLAAIRFLVKRKESETIKEDRLTACWFEVTSEKEFITAGNLQFTPTTTEWKGVTYATPISPLYKWATPQGVPFSSTETAIAYSDQDGSSTHDGWLLLIPQHVSVGTISFCFTTMHSSHKVKLDLLNSLETGKRYTITFTLSQQVEIDTQSDVEVAIEDWNIVEDTNSSIDFSNV